MTYSAGNKIVASDLNSFKDTFNGLWSTGSGTYGYGQSAVSGVSAGQLIRASDWSPLVDNLKKVLLHQGTAFTPMTTPTALTLASAISALSPNYVSAESSANRFNAASVGNTTTYTTTATSTSSFNGDQTITVSASFGSHDQARYFFNAGGQFSLNFTHPTAPLAAIASNLGNIRFGAGNGQGGTQSIGGTAYYGTTKVGGSATGAFTDTAKGFYNITTTDTIIAYQYDGTSTAEIELYARYDNAGTITFTAKAYAWTGTQPASPPTIASGSTVSVAARQPPTTYLTNTWGGITFSTNVSQTSSSVAQWYLYSSSGSLLVPTGKTTARIVLIAGGANGETATGLTIKGGGGGGAGQVKDIASYSVSGGQTLTFTVGAGAAGSVPGYGNTGGTTTLSGGSGGVISATGGGTTGGGTLGQGGTSGGGYTGGSAYIYGRQVYAGGGGGGAQYYGFNGAQSGTVFEGEGGIGGVGYTIGPVNGSYYNVGGGGGGGMNKQITTWTLADETGYKYGGGLGGVYTGIQTSSHGVAGTGGGGGGGAQNTSTLNVVGGNGGSGFVAIYM